LIEPPVPENPPRIENERDQRTIVPAMRGGAGSVMVRHFRFAEAAAPARFLTLEIPPGAAEGLHTHFADDRNGMGAYDEFYYVIAGRGSMTVGTDTFAVEAGDYIHAPLDCVRGIANADPVDTLKIHLTVVLRESSPEPGPEPSGAARISA
jgi:mannose-6-phosphate isomerase-like protein (cupin superfamily)